MGLGDVICAIKYSANGAQYIIFSTELIRKGEN